MTRIDKGIPIPTKESKYPWLEMEIGDSFIIDTKTRAVAAVQCSRSGTRYARKFICREHGKHIRVWRTA